MERILSLHIQQRSTSCLLTSDVDLGRLVQYPFSIKRIDRSLKLSVLPTRADRHHPSPSRGILHRNVYEQITCRRVMDSVWSSCLVRFQVVWRQDPPNDDLVQRFGGCPRICVDVLRVSRGIRARMFESWLSNPDPQRMERDVRLPLSWETKRETASEWISAIKEVSAAPLLHWLSIATYTHHLEWSRVATCNGHRMQSF